MKVPQFIRALIFSTVVFALSGCGTLSSISEVFELEPPQQSGGEPLSDLEKAQRARLLAGKSGRASLASLDLMPQRRDGDMNEPTDNKDSADKQMQASQASTQPSWSKQLTQDIPTLSLAQKKAEYEALLPLITDPTQRRQAAFRLADINMLLAERALEQGQNVVQLAEQQTIQLPSAEQALEHPFESAIESYRAVLNQHKTLTPVPSNPLSPEDHAFNRKQMDAMYQLSRALDLSGQKQQSVEVAKTFLTTFNLPSFGITEQHIELYFRIGEYYFNRSEYVNAAEYYGLVVSGYDQAQLQNSANFYGISSYMLGWSEFKQDKYNEALHAFDLMVKHTLKGSQNLELVTLNDIDSLSKGEMRLLKDSIRIMALTFSYQGSGKAIADFYAQRPVSPYQHLVYEELAQQYLDEDRFSDSADALLVFAQNHPFHTRAVEFYVRHIDAYILGGFADRVMLAKQKFVETYSLDGPVLSRLDSPIALSALPYLKVYLTELAQTEHSIAQGIDAILYARAAATAKQIAPNDEPQDVLQGFVTEQLSAQQNTALRSASTTDLNSLRLEAYQQAVDYYENFIRTFTYADGRYDKQVPERRFYLAEAYIALNRYAQAIAAFETYAYDDTPNPLAAEAAYAAILAHAQMDTQTAVADDALPQDIKPRQDAQLTNAQFSQQRFVLTFADDRRTPVIALNLMQTLFNSRLYVQAQRWAKWILNEAPLIHQASVQQQVSATLVMAHSEFELAQFASAESYYRALLMRPEYIQISTDSAFNSVLNSPSNKADSALNVASKREDLVDRLAATLYKQAEQALDAINLTPSQLALETNVYDMSLSDIKRDTINLAIAFWQTIISDAPSASFRVNAQFDSASYYALLGEWEKAIATWIDFASRYPDNALTASIEGQLLFAYQQTEDWEAAANILLAQYNSNQQSEMGRESLFQAASFYQRANNRNLALNTFRTYAHTYPQPMDMANEARFILSEFYLESGEDSKRRFWLNKLVEAQQALAANKAAPVASVGDARSRYLAAMAAMVFATDADTVFTRIKLTLPLDESLAKKQGALSEAINAYDVVMSFAVAEYATEANYHLANLYMQLAADLMSSSRPEGLSALELNQYELLLEEQAYPFEETAIGLHENNVSRVHSGLYDEYIKQSFSVLSKTLPARYNKQEMTMGVSANDL